MNRFAVAFTGPSGSGKTTIVEKVAKILIATKEVAIIKNDPKDKAIFDVEGKDSYKFSQTGAEVVVTSPTRTTYFSKRHKELDEIIEMFNHFDILLVEGLKTLPLPRIAIFRDQIDESYLDCSEAIAIDESVDINKYKIPKEIDILNLNDTSEIINWIEKNAKEV
ncbi:molybdopterin-guanine dinucleotide biosynthesis protein B [Sulfurovum sp. bin170]|uniref:molybdopterin-guanine dinucleotide biosynthesis protein B n=1 Tax=Sulfurovum sp. bin170 TaxID=2695268 RepID=UPI0013E00B0C|nr:molybdopterin-guanine dinucleotide biosynthesis protein B [Sulfurovum sp. bin170]NEW60559.1 molybdopterin-guanine dinucleotide biosynthesis protein B [Sulfurovum sp. bin170]